MSTPVRDSSARDSGGRLHFLGADTDTRPASPMPAQAGPA